MNYPFFTQVDPFVMQGLSQLTKILQKIMPMNTAQKKDLAYAVKDLSEELTSERDFARPYWSSPRLTSAYMHYFLPWNIIRLSRLFPALNFGKIPAAPLIVDLGSGPLTLPITFWLSRKDLRQKPVTFVCADIASQPLQLGRTLFDELRKEMDPKSEWKIHVLRTPLFKALKEVRGNPWLISMGNVLNEGEEKKAHPMQKQIEQILKDAKNILREDGKIFAVEPGTRQGARVLSLLRQSATQLPAISDELDDDHNDMYDEGYTHESDNFVNIDSPNLQEISEEVTEAPFIALAPCPHNELCPLSTQYAQVQRKLQKYPMKASNAWCHFNTPADYVPNALRQLSQRAGMDKQSISLSFLYLALKKEGERILRAQTKQYGDISDKARVISEAFPIPDYRGRARYACHKTGLLLLVDSAPLANASLCDIMLSRPLTKDQKSGAALAKADYEDFSQEFSNSQFLKEKTKKIRAIKEKTNKPNIRKNKKILFKV